MRIVGWCVLLSAAVAAGAQVRQTRPPTSKNVYFPDGKPLGLPPDTKLGSPRCSADGYTFLNVKEDAEVGLPKLYRIAVGGEVQLVTRKVPLQAKRLRMLDFYPGEQLVTLMEAVEGNGDEDEAHRDVEYFVATSDHDGDHANLVKLDVRFTPMRIAQFPSGDFLVLGWDRFHTTSVLVQAQEDGSVRRFMDLNADQIPENKDGAKSPGGGQFVPFDKQILLTFPGTSKPVHVLSEGADERTFRPAVPPGYVFHDILNSTGRGLIVMRVQVEETAATSKDGGADHPLKQRLFDIDTLRGGQIYEYLFEKPPMQAVTCGANYQLTAIYTQPAVGGSANDAGKDSPQAVSPEAASGGSDKPQVLVISSARR